MDTIKQEKIKEKHGPGRKQNSWLGNIRDSIEISEAGTILEHTENSVW